MAYGNRYNPCGEEYFQLLDTLYHVGYTACDQCDDEEYWNELQGDQWDDNEKSAFWAGWQQCEHAARMTFARESGTLDAY